MTLSAAHVENAPCYSFLGTHMRILLASAQTGGQFTMIEGIMPPGGDGGLHIHHREDESMCLLEGELEVTIGDEVFTLKAGESYFAPRDVPQRLRNLGQTPARSVLVTTPGGFDEFVTAAGQACGPIPEPMRAPTMAELIRIQELTAAFGITVLVAPAIAVAG